MQIYACISYLYVYLYLHYISIHIFQNSRVMRLSSIYICSERNVSICVHTIFVFEFVLFLYLLKQTGQVLKGTRVYACVLYFSISGFLKLQLSNCFSRVSLEEFVINHIYLKTDSICETEKQFVRFLCLCYWGPYSAIGKVLEREVEVLGG